MPFCVGDLATVRTKDPGDGEGADGQQLSQHKWKGARSIGLAHQLNQQFIELCRCEQCHAEKLVAFSCKKRGFCPSCGARRMAETAALLTDQILPERPLRQWVLSLPMALRFLLATRPAVLSAVLGVVYRTISGHLLGEARLSRRTGHTGAVTLIQRFGSGLNLNVHLHMIFIDGAYRSDGTAPPVFHAVPPPATADLQALVQRIAERLGRMLEKRGLLERDAESAWLNGEPAEAGALDDLIGHSITYRIAVGPRAGQKVFRLQSIAAQPERPERAGRHGAAEAGGFSLHAGLDIQPGERAKLERLCRYVSRPPVATERLALTPSGQVRYPLKTPYRDGTTHIVLEPLDLMARLAALVPPPRMHLTRYHGVFAPHSRLRAAITPAGCGAGGKGAKQDANAEAPAVPKHVAMSWAQRLKRVFAIEIDTCARCQGRLRVIASIEEPEVIARILAHRERDCGAAEPELAPIVARAPPRQGRLL